MAVVPWKVTIPTEEQREFEEMVESFRPEFPGILNWLIEGVKIFLTEGLVIPEAVEKATQEYRDDMDRTAGFIKRGIGRDENAQPVQSKVLYDAYKEDCEEQGITHPLSHQAFGKIMKKKFHHVEGRVAYYHGIVIMRGNISSPSASSSGYDERYPPPHDADPFDHEPDR
jgi:putative DNA primase/helicase